MTIDAAATALTQARYQRLSAIYDVIEGMAEGLYRPWRQKLWALAACTLPRPAERAHILEAGVGTGKNMPYWPTAVQMTAFDLTPGMLEIARQRARALGLSANISLGDVQALDFPDASFDIAVASFVFCSVPDPVMGLRELARVVRPGGQVLLLEHVRTENLLAGGVMDALNPLIVSLMGANINRRTVAHVLTAGLHLEHLEELGLGGIFKLIVARVA